MHKLTAQWGQWTSDGLRTRFRPRGRIAQPFLQIVPWLNIGLVLALLFVLAGRLTLRPGVVFELPRAAFREGMQRGPRIVMIRVQRAEGPQTLVFFDDVRYRLDLPEQNEQLRAELARAALRPEGRQLLLLADATVPHGDVISLVDLAREVGVRRVNVSVRPE